MASNFSQINYSMSSSDEYVNKEKNVHGGHKNYGISRENS